MPVIAGPAERGVDEHVVIGAVEELHVGRLLTDANGKLAAKKLLLDPELVKPRRGQRLDAADQHQIADIAARQPVAVDLEHVGVEGGAGPSRDLLQIDGGAEVEAAGINPAGADTAGDVRQPLPDIGRAELDAGVGQRLPRVLCDVLLNVCRVLCMRGLGRRNNDQHREQGQSAKQRVAHVALPAYLTIPERRITQ